MPPWAAAAAIGAAVVGGVASNRAANKAADANQKAIDANAYQGQIATDQYDDYKNTYRPLEHNLASEVQSYDTPQAYQRAAGNAQARVAQQFGLAQQRLTRTPGFDPSSAAAQAAHTDLERHAAATSAAEQNRAREQVHDKGFARKLDIAGLGRGLVTNASTGFANASATASHIAHANSVEANQTASGVGAAVGGIINSIGKANSGGFGLNGAANYNNWAASNAGVAASTGLSTSDLQSAF